MSQSKENNEDSNDEMIELAKECDLIENGEKENSIPELDINENNETFDFEEAQDFEQDSRKRKASQPLTADQPKEKRASFKNCTFSSRDLKMLLQSGAHFENCKFE